MQTFFMLSRIDTPTPDFFISISAFSIFISITASLGNALILVALSLHPPQSKLFIRCLSTTDFCDGLIAEPVVDTHL